MADALTCPNTPPCRCALHDIYEPGDPYPTCCTDGCPCGHPGDAVLTRHDDGTVTVTHADPVIRVNRELLDDMTAAGSSQWDPDTEMLILDTAGTHRYRYLRPDPNDHRVLIFGRLP